jgi:hypothetical protein
VDQAIVDQYEPYGASYLTAGSVQEKIVRGLKLSVVDWELLPSSTNTKRNHRGLWFSQSQCKIKYLGSSTKQVFHPLDNRAGLIHQLFDQNLEILAARGIHVQTKLFGFG